MGAKSFTHMDEIRRRRILARAAARAEAGGTLPRGAVDFAWLLFGDPAISKVVDSYVDLSAIGEFERNIEAVKAALAQVCGGLLKSQASSYPASGAADVRKQFAHHGKGSRKREISRRIPAHMEYLRQRVIYVALNRLLMEHYAAEDMTPQSPLAAKDWVAHRDATSDQIAAVEKALAEAAEKKGSPPSAASILVRKPHKSRGRPRGTPSAIGSTLMRDAEVIAEAVEAAVEAADTGEVDTRTVTSIATSSADADATAAEDFQHALQDANEQAANDSPSEDSRTPAGKPAAPSVLDGPTEETVDFRVKDILIRQVIADRLTPDEREIARIYRDIELTPIDLLGYYVRAMPHNLIRQSSFRLVDFMRKFGDYNVSCDFDGFLGAEPQEGFYERVDMHRRKLHQRGARYFEEHGLDLIPDLFKAKMPEDLARGIGLFRYFRRISGGTAFDADATPLLDADEARDMDPTIKSPPTNWWEFVYGYNAYTQYNFYMARLFLKGLSLLDVHSVVQKRQNILKSTVEPLPLAIFSKKGCFYEEIAAKHWKSTFSQEYIEFKINEITKIFVDFPSLQNHTVLDNVEAAHTDARERWFADISAPGVRKDWRPNTFV